MSRKDGILGKSMILHHSIAKNDDIEAMLMATSENSGGLHCKFARVYCGLGFRKCEGKYTLM